LTVGNGLAQFFAEVLTPELRIVLGLALAAAGIVTQFLMNRNSAALAAARGKRLAREVKIRA
jgi:hypothetical protein